MPAEREMRELMAERDGRTVGGSVGQQHDRSSIRKRGAFAPQRETPACEGVVRGTGRREDDPNRAVRQRTDAGEIPRVVGRFRHGSRQRLLIRPGDGGHSTYGDRGRTLQQQDQQRYSRGGSSPLATRSSIS